MREASETVLGQLARAADGGGWLQVAEERLSFADLLERSRRVAAGLRDAGLQPGDRVATILANRIEQVELLFACAASGVVAVPMGPFLRGEFMRHHLRDADPQLLVADASARVESASHLRELASLRAVVDVDSSGLEAPVPVLPYAQLREQPPLAAYEPNRRDSVAMLFTSGTTGASKCCAMSNAYYVNTGAMIAEAWRVSDRDVMLTALPMHHGAGQIASLMTALVGGASFHALESFRASSFVEQARASGATLAMGVGAMARALLARDPSPSDRDHSLRLVLMSPLDVESQRAFTERFGVPLTPQAYGQTETIGVTVASLDEVGTPTPNVGRPSPLFDVRVVDEHDEDVPVGSPGEIVVRPLRTGVMFDGYWRRPQDTLERWRNLWHHTGDVGFLDADGYLTFLDRGKDAIRRRGENVSSAELEAAIRNHPKVEDVAVHALPASMTEDDIKACIVLADGERTDPEELFEFFRAQLPYFAIPRYVEVMDELPRESTSMRVRKQALRERGIGDASWDLEALGLTVAAADRRAPAA